MLSGRSAGFLPLLEAVGFVARFQNVTVMREAVE